MAATETARVPEDISGRLRRMPVGGITWRHTFRALRHRNYRLFFWGQLVSLIGTWMQQTAMSWFVYQITNSKLLLGTRRRRLVRADDAVLDLGRLAGRSLSETLDHRRDANRTNDLRFFAGSRRLVRVRDTIVHYYYRCAQWRSDGLRHACAPGVYRRNGKPRRLLNAISLNSSIVNGARIVGPSVAGLMIGAVGVATCFLLNGITFIAVIVGLLMMRLPPFEPPAHAVSAGEHAWTGIVYSIKHQRVRTILLLFLAVGVFGWSYAVLMPAFARDVLGRG